jgi:hypothetical protein
MEGYVPNSLKTYTVVLLLAATALAQSGPSLGDVARANREKQQDQQAAGTRHRVITNADLPADPPGVPESDPSEPMTMVSGVSRPFENRSFDQRFAQQDRGQQRAGEQWRERIQNQESRIAELQGRIDQINASIHSAGSGTLSEGPYNRYQALQMQRIAQMQEMLDIQKRKLTMMQEEARHAGMHTNVYDP